MPSDFKSIFLFGAVALLMIGLILLVAICNAVWYYIMRRSNREPSQCPSRQLSEPLLQSKSGGGVSLNRPAGRDDIHQLLPHFMINPTSIDYSPSCVDFENPDQFSMEGSTQAIGDHDPASEDGLSTT